MSRTTRDAILFFVGLAGVVYLTVVGPVNRDLLLFFGAMLGLPVFLRSDERKNGKAG